MKRLAILSGLLMIPARAACIMWKPRFLRITVDVHENAFRRLMRVRELS